MILCATFTRACRAERVDWLPGRSIAPPRLRPWVNACDRHPIAMPPRKPLYILVGMFYNPSEDTLESRREATLLARASERARSERARVHAFPRAAADPPRSPLPYLIPLINVHALPRAFGDSVEPEGPLDSRDATYRACFIVQGSWQQDRRLYAVSRKRPYTGGEGSGVLALFA